MTELSVIVPCYNEEPNLKELSSRLLRVFDSRKIDGEVILVNDGSADGTFEIEDLSVNGAVMVTLDFSVEGYALTLLGLAIKRRSPFRHTVVVELANDYIGYIPDKEACALGGYQVWTGFHSFVAKGTGEMMVDEAVGLLAALQDA